MAKGGPAPEPTSLRIMKGNPSHRPINKAEPQPRAVAPTSPIPLSERAIEFWNYFVPILASMKVLSEADGVPLANLCNAMCTLEEAQEMIKTEGLIMVSKSGWLQISPFQSLIQQQMKIIGDICSQFGLTPSSRTKIKSNDNKTTEWGDF